MVDVVICAHNEATTIGGVLAAALGARSADAVIVVADRCTDDTENITRRLGAHVLPGNFGDKGSVMAAGLAVVRTDLVCFLDADLSGLTAEHVEALLTAPPHNGQVVGVRDRAGELVRHLPSVSGERRLPAAVARAAGLAGSGWAAETRLNVAVARAGLPWAQYVMLGVTNPTRPDPAKYLAVLGHYLISAPELGRYLAHPNGGLQSPDGGG